MNATSTHEEPGRPEPDDETPAPDPNQPPPDAPPDPNQPPPFAARYGLVRPAKGRYLGGVCAAVARATNTDPLLWRVVLVVLTIFGGVGLLLYLIGWLVIPAEGATTSALEAGLGRGRGRSGTSSAAAIMIGVLAVAIFAAASSNDLRSLVLGAAVILGIALLISRSGGAAGSAAGTTTDAAAGTPSGATPQYSPPFAPGGPFALSDPSAGPQYPPPAPPPSIGLSGAAAAPRPPKPPRSRLGLVVLSVSCLALGVLAAVDISGVRVPVLAYVAVPLTVIGSGLVVGAWLGRARWLIAPGLLLTVALFVGSAMAGMQWHFAGAPNTGDLSWRPGSIAELQPSYTVAAGSGRLDLSGLDFTEHDTDVEVSVDVGGLEVVLPPNVDVDVDAKVHLGDGTVLHTQWSGIDKSGRHVADNGSDGPGGGHLHLTVTVNVGTLEVHR